MYFAAHVEVKVEDKVEIEVQTTYTLLIHLHTAAQVEVLSDGLPKKK